MGIIKKITKLANNQRKAIKFETERKKRND